MHHSTTSRAINPGQNMTGLVFDSELPGIIHFSRRVGQSISEVSCLEGYEKSWNIEICAVFFNDKI